MGVGPGVSIEIHAFAGNISPLKEMPLSRVAQGSNWNTATPKVKDKEHLFSIT